MWRKQELKQLQQSGPGQKPECTQTIEGCPHGNFSITPQRAQRVEDKAQQGGQRPSSIRVPTFLLPRWLPHGLLSSCDRKYLEHHPSLLSQSHLPAQPCLLSSFTTSCYTYVSPPTRSSFEAAHRNHPRLHPNTSSLPLLQCHYILSSVWMGTASCYVQVRQTQAAARDTASREGISRSKLNWASTATGKCLTGGEWHSLNKCNLKSTGSKMLATILKSK